jgi:hypothetical protein
MNDNTPCIIIAVKRQHAPCTISTTATATRPLAVIDAVNSATHVTGSYTQPDPLRFVDGPSVYAYTKGSPAMIVDRLGLAIAPKELPHLPMPSPSRSSGVQHRETAKWRECHDFCWSVWSIHGETEVFPNYRRCMRECLGPNANYELIVSNQRILKRRGALCNTLLPGKETDQALVFVREMKEVDLEMDLVRHLEQLVQHGNALIIRIENYYPELNPDS